MLMLREKFGPCYHLRIIAFPKNAHGCGAAVNWKTTFDVTQVRFGLVGPLINYLQDEPKGECFQPSFVHQVSLAFGLAVMAIASFTGHVSGGKCSFVF